MAGLWAAYMGMQDGCMPSHIAPTAGAWPAPALAPMVHIWDVASRTAIRRLRGYGSAIKAVKFSPDGRWLAGAGGDRVIYFWPVRDGAAADADQPARVLQGHDDHIETVAFSADGRLLVSASLDQTARLWSVDSGQVLHVLAGHTAALAGAAFSPRGDRIATISYDDTVRLWDVATGRCVAGWEGLRAGGIAIVFSPTGDLLAHTHNHVDLVLRDVTSGSVSSDAAWAQRHDLWAGLGRERADPGERKRGWHVAPVECRNG